MAFRQRAAQLRGAGVGVAVEPGRRRLVGGERRGQGPERSLVGGELHDPVEAVLLGEHVHGWLGPVGIDLVEGSPQWHPASLSPAMGELRERFPLFPLGLVLLPGEVVPLHIFEERYKTMIGECLDQESEFGILWMGDDGLQEVGCSARIDEVLERMDDGRLNIAVRGTEPFRLSRRIDDMEYPAGDIELLEDDDVPEAEAAERALTRATRRSWSA